MSGEMNWTGGSEAKVELDNLRREKQSAHIYEYKRQKYINQGNKPKVATRNIRREGDKLIVDIKPVTFPVYSNFSKEGANTELRNFAEAAATCMAIITADGKLLLQHRADSAEVFGDMIGASIAGYFDGTFHRPQEDKLHTEKKGTLEPITVASVLANIKRESTEEMGIEEADFSSIVLAGLCEEVKPQPHHEFLFNAKTKLTSQQIKDKALNTVRARKKELKPEDIEEKFEFIDATPENIMALLTKVKSPLPPTHAAVFAAAGYELMLERNGKTAADEYKKRLEQGIKQNYEAMDAMVKEYYQKNPQALNSIPERLIKKVETTMTNFKQKNPNATEQDLAKIKTDAISHLPKRDPSGYSPSYLPKEQGLPEFEAALKEYNLI